MTEAVPIIETSSHKAAKMPESERRGWKFSMDAASRTGNAQAVRRTSGDCTFVGPLRQRYVRSSVASEQAGTVTSYWWRLPVRRNAGSKQSVQNKWGNYFEEILDSGPHSRLYAWSMASIPTVVQATFQIGAVAKRTALSVDAIRFYERRKLLPTPFRSAGRFRLYTRDDIERLRFVQRMQRLGFSLEEIKQLMAIRTDRAHACASVRQFLKTKLNGVKTRIRDLQQLETELKSDLGKCNHALKRQRGKTCACPMLEEIARTSNV